MMKDHKKRIEDVRIEVQRRLIEKQSVEAPSKYVQPRYDEVFTKGTKWLDSRLDCLAPKPPPKGHPPKIIEHSYQCHLLDITDWMMIISSFVVAIMICHYVF